MLKEHVPSFLSRIGGSNRSFGRVLHRFPIDTLKVDRSFVGSENGEIVRTVLALAKILKLEVVAEGIETIHQFHQLRVLGCEFGQGFLFSKGLPVGEIKKMLSDKFNWEKILPLPPSFAIADNSKYAVLPMQ